MITHTVSFTWKPDIPDGQVDMITEALRGLPAAIASIRTYSVGRNAGISPGASADFAVVATFDDADGWRAYDVHPELQRVRSELIVPWVQDRSAIQFES